MTQHPTLHALELRCTSCGASLSVRSTATEISLDVCSSCHPAYTGRTQLTAAGSRVERFNRRRALAA